MKTSAGKRIMKTKSGMIHNKNKTKPVIRKVKIKNHVSVFARTHQKSEIWIGEIHEELKWANADSVYHLLRAVLQTLRDHLSVDEAAHLSAQLPLLLKGTFYECWNPQTGNTKGLSKDDFLKDVRKKMGFIGEQTFDLEQGVSVALKVIARHVSKGEMTNIFNKFRPSLKDFFDHIEHVPSASQLLSQEEAG